MLVHKDKQRIGISREFYKTASQKILPSVYGVIIGFAYIGAQILLLKQFIFVYTEYMIRHYLNTFTKLHIPDYTFYIVKMLLSVIQPRNNWQADYKRDSHFVYNTQVFQYWF